MCQQPTVRENLKVRYGFITIYASKSISAEVWKKPETTPGLTKGTEARGNMKQMYVEEKSA